MKIKLSGAGKRFNRDWIFKNVSLDLDPGKAYAITGPNGSGKSTLLQMIATMMDPSAGSLSYIDRDEKTVAKEKVHRHISFCAPYLEIVEEMTVLEFLHFHQQFKPFMPGLTPELIIEKVGLSGAIKKQIRFFSSGMKQRVKLAQAIFSNTDVLLLDEPCSNFDQAGIELYHSLIESYTRQRLVIVCSNDITEYSFCKEVHSVMEWK